MTFDELRFKYTFYGFLIEFLVQTHGIKKLQDYLKRYLKNPDTYEMLFIEIYGSDVTEILKQYQSSLNL
jgi:hypothetical protein